MAEEMTDFELATEIRVAVSKLNGLGIEASKRELMVKYAVLGQQNAVHQLQVNVMTDVA